MARIPDRFDLLIHKARECPDPVRQLDYILGSLSGLLEWHFLNVGTPEKPQPAGTYLEGEAYLLIFSDPERIGEIAGENVSIISIPADAALPWCVEQKAGLLVNAGENAAAIPFPHVRAFHDEWAKRGARSASGFWIPNMTSEEEDFWQSHEL